MVDQAEPQAQPGPELPQNDNVHVRERAALDFLKKSRQAPEPTPQTQEETSNQETPEPAPAPGPEEAPEVGEEEPQALEIDPGAKIKVKASGEEREVTVQELKDSYASRSELSRLANQVLDDKKAVGQAREEYGAALSKVKSLMEKMKGSPPDVSLRDRDPAEYLKLKDQYEDRLKAIEALDGEIETVNGQKSKEEENSKLDYARKEYAKILQKVPNFEKDKGAILDYAMSIGAEEKEIRGVHPAWVYEVAHKAMQWDKLQAANPKVQNRLREAPTMSRPGVQAPRDPNREVTQLQAKLRDPKTSMREREALVIQLNRLQRQQQPPRQGASR